MIFVVKGKFSKLDRIRKPRATRKVYLDYQGIYQFLAQRLGLSDQKLEDAFAYFAEGHHNGKFIHFEQLDDDEFEVKTEDERLRKRMIDLMFKTWPEAVSEYGEIQVWYWW